MSIFDRLRPAPSGFQTIPSEGSPHYYDPLTRNAIVAAANQYKKGSTSSVEQNAKFLFNELAAQDRNPYEDEAYLLIEKIRRYKSMLDSEQSNIRAMFRRFDNLYDPQNFTVGGADHWPDGIVPGRVHVSVNSPRAYVDIPASLQALQPVENLVPNDIDDREKAARVERLYFKWLDETDREVIDETICQVKALYGWTFVKVFWDAQRKMPNLQVIENPENLYVGWGASDYRRMDWTIYCYQLSPQAIEEDFGLGVDAIETPNHDVIPFVLPGSHDDPLQTLGTSAYNDKAPGRRTKYDDLMVEVYDFWYKKPTGAGKAPEIWNALYVGNRLVENARHREFDNIPYIQVKNGSVPGSPYAPSELYDIEQLIREKDERMSEQAAAIHNVIAGQRWQLTGPDAPDEVPSNALPGPNQVAAPGPGNRIEPITPFIGEFAVEDYLKRVDRELSIVSGLNDLLLGTVPSNSLNSSKAISAMVANYEARIARKRKLLFRARREIWEMAAKVWERKDKQVAAIIDGHYRLEIKPPELTPRDDAETANRAIALTQARIWSMARAADATGVEDPEGEQDIIREEQTDASLNPASGLQLVQLLAAYQQFAQQPPPIAQQQLQAAAQSGAAAQREANRPPRGSASANSPNGGATPPAQAQPGNTQQGQEQGAGGNLLSQTLVGTNGQVSGRLLSQQEIG